MREYLLAIVILLSSGISPDTYGAGLDRDMVPDSATATKVGGAILETWMGKQQFAAMIKDAPLEAFLNGDTWSVSAGRPNMGSVQYEQNGMNWVTVTAGGGEPIIELSKHDAQVKRIYFTR